jgi:hypothetical protein
MGLLVLWENVSILLWLIISTVAVYETLITDLHGVERLTFNEGSH